MNKIKGAVWTKLLGWIVWSISLVSLVGCLIGLLAMDSYQVFSKSEETLKREEFTRINEGYAACVVKGYLEGGEKIANKYLTDSGVDFRYRIYEEKPEDLEKGYVYSHGFESQMTENTVMHEIPAKAEVHIGRDWLGIPYVYYWDYNEQGLYYCDKICFDEDTGIFYYHTNSYLGQTTGNDFFFPAREIGIVHYEYVSAADDAEGDLQNAAVDAERNLLETENTPIYEESAEEFSVLEGWESEAFEQMILHLSYEEITGNYKIRDESGNLYFSEIDLKDLLNAEDELVFDGIRNIRFMELTKMHSGLYPNSAFPYVTYSYLNQNLSLAAGIDGSEGYVFVASILPTVDMEYGNGIFQMMEQVLGAGELTCYERVSALIHLLYSLKGTIWIWILSSFLILTGSTVFLMMAAGYRKNQEELVLTPLDKIPFDLYAAVVFSLGMGVLLLLDAFSYEINDAGYVFLITVGLLGLLIAWLCLALLLSFAVRVKHGKWWRNTLIYLLITKILIGFFWKWFVRIVRFIGRGFRILWEARTLPFKVIAGWSVFLFAEILFIAIGVHEGEAFVLLFFEKIIETLVIFGIALQMRKIKIGTEKIASGDVRYQIDTNKMLFDLKSMGENINHIGEGIGAAVDERMKSERFKTELITNVSHDIKTPLTSIINYVDLLQKEEINNEKAEEYLEVLERQSERLKKLIEDLVEASKASSGALSVSEELIDLNVFLTQAAGEYQEKMEKSQLTLVLDKPDAVVEAVVDGRHLWRVLDNLMNNVCKYALPGSRVYLSLTENGQIIMKNISQYELNITAEELMERFVRGDASRHTEGHGLGLSIAKSLMELMGGSLEIVIDGDLFKVILSL